MTRIHEPTTTCDGHHARCAIRDATGRTVAMYDARCTRCTRPLCACQMAHGHDCEEPTP